MDIWDVEQEESTPATKRKLEAKVIVLSNIQKELVLNRWKDESKTPPSIAELLKLAFPKENLDGRSKQASFIKELLVENGCDVTEKQEKEDEELKPEHREYIRNNCSSMKIMEMARTLFGNNIQPGSMEVKQISALVRGFGGDKSDDIKEYVAPNTADRVVARVRNYVEEAKNWDAKKLTPGQKKNVEALMNYLASHRFKHQIDSYEENNDKELFEHQFIKYTFDKPDLTQENCDQYILLCSEILNGSQIQKTINMLQREQDRFLNEEGKVSMAVVEAVKTARQEHGDCVKRQQALYKSLTQERSDKLSEDIKDKATLLNLFSAWKNYETRQQILKLRQNKKEDLRKELHEIDNMDEMKQRVLGLSIEEVIDG